VGKTVEQRLAEELAQDIEGSKKPVAIRLRDVRDKDLGQERLTLHRRRELQRAFDAEGLSCSPPLTDADLDEVIEVSLVKVGVAERLRRWIARPVLSGVQWAAILLGLVAAIVALYPLTQGSAGPDPMSGDVNLVVTGFADQRSEAAGRGLGETLFRSLRISTRPSDDPTDPDIQVRGPNAVDPVGNLVQAKKVAMENAAQIVVYGKVVHRPTGTVALPRFYVDPHLLSGAEEMGGDFPLPTIKMGNGGTNATIAGRAELRALVNEDFGGLSAFAIGLAWFNAARWERARVWFDRAQGQWRQGQGAALSSLFIGNAEGKLGNFSAARSAYLHALDLAPDLKRAELGLTEIQLHQAAPSCPDRIDKVGLYYVAMKFGHLYDEAGGSGLPRRAFLLRSRLGEARANLCLGLAGSRYSADSAAHSFREVLRVGAGTELFNPELAEARAGLGLSVLQAEPGRDERRSYLRAKAEYQQARQLTNDPERARAFAQIIALIDAHLHESVWNRTDPLPEGVRAGIEYYGVGDSVCGPELPRQPEILIDRRPFYQFEIVPNADDPELGETLSLCPRGLSMSEPVQLVIRGPEGFVRRATLGATTDDLERYVTYWLGREWAPGAYSAVASQDSREVRLSFRVVLPRHRGVRVPITVGRPRPEPLPVMVVGQPPDSRVTVDIYKEPSGYSAGPAKYATSFELQTNEDGIAEIRLPISPGDDGRFILRAREMGSYENQDLLAWLSICNGGEC
jgi:tetratricopeptide (TPR) repeat protein